MNERGGDIASTTQSQRRGQTLFGFFLYLTLLSLVVVLALAVVGTHRKLNRGIVYGRPAVTHRFTERPLGVNTALEQYEERDLQRALDRVEEAGFRWVRQRFPWAEIERQPDEYRWAPWDRIVESLAARDIQLIAVLDTAPAWARSEADRGNPLAPPRDPGAFAQFVRAFVSHYRGSLRAVQIWDEPNIYPHWGEGWVDPAAYTRLLEAGYVAAKEDDPRVLVLTAGLAPTTENTDRNVSDVQFLKELYRSGGGDFFDVLAIQPYGFWSGPDDRRVDPQVLNFSRAVLLREIMVSQGDADKPLWAVEFGWNALPTGWKGRASPWGSDDVRRQAGRTIQALQRARREWPWMGIMAIQHLQPAAPLDDPVWGFSLLDGDFQPRLFFQRLRQFTTDPLTAPLGRFPAAAWFAAYRGGWQRGAEGARVGGVDDEVSMRFWGTGVDVVGEAAADTTLAAMVDGESSREMPPSLDGTATTLARGLSPGEHALDVMVAEGAIHLRQWAVVREPDFARYYAALTLLAGALLIVAWRLVCLLRSPSWLAIWRSMERGYRGLSEPVQLALLGAAAGWFYLTPFASSSLIALIPLAALIYWRLDFGLVLVAFSTPFFFRPKSFGPKVVSLVEILTLLCAALWLIQWVGWRRPVLWTDLSRRGRAALQHLTVLDMAVLFFVVAGIGSLAVSQHKGVSLRELRVAVVEPALFYFLVRVLLVRKQMVLRLADALLAAAIVVALIGLYQYAFTDHVITAEGVRRLRSVYGSPNNAALFLSRVVPIAFAVAAFAQGSRRRFAYGAALIALVPALFLTYSRGAWLIGLPAAVLFVGAVRGRRSLALAVAAVALALLALLPFAQVERIASLLDLREGTTFRRLKLWEATLHMIRDHPLFGVGLDNFLYQYRDNYLLPEAWQEPDLSHPHNVLLNFWVRLGLPGVVALIWLQVSFFRRAREILGRTADPATQALVLGLAASMVNFLAHGLIDNAYFVPDLAYVFMLTLGLVTALQVEERRAEDLDEGAGSYGV